MFKSLVKRRLQGRRLRVLGKHLRAKGWQQVIPILRIIRWIERICKLVWVEIRHKDQINVCIENRWLKFWTDSCSYSCAHVLSSKNCRYFRFDWHCGQRKTKNCYCTAIGQHMTCFEGGRRLFWSSGPSDIVMAGGDKRVALLAGKRWQILCPM